jgi:hypothetical protein
MKKRTFFVLTALSLVLCLSIIHCGKAKETASPKIAEDLIQRINQGPFGFAIKVDPADISMESLGGKQYLITLKNSGMTFDTAALKDLNIGVPLKSMKIPLKTEELVLRYSPGKEYLAMVSGKGIVWDWDFSDVLNMPENQPPGINQKIQNMVLNMKIGSVAYKAFDISALINPELKNVFQLLKEMMDKNRSFEWSIKDLTYDIHLTDMQNREVSIILEAEKMTGQQDVCAEVFIPLYEKAGQSPDFKTFLGQGKPLFNLEGDCSMFKLYLKKDGQIKGGNTVDKMSFSYFLKPDETGSAFIYGFTLDMNAFKLSLPLNKDAEKLSNIPRWNIAFSLENINPGLAQAYFDLTKASMSMSRPVSTSQQDNQQIKAQHMMMGVKIMNAFVQSKPIIKFSFSPFKHYLGELTAEGKFQVLTIGPPVGKAALKILDVRGVLKKLKEEDTISSKTVEWISRFFAEHVMKDGKGNGTITFEIKKDQPGKYFLNGSPL